MAAATAMEPQVIVCPAVGKSHGMAIMNFTVRLANRGLKVVVVHDSHHLAELREVWSCPADVSIEFRSISGADDQCWDMEFTRVIKELIPHSLLLLADSYSPWALSKAFDLGLPYAIFYPTAVTVNVLELGLAAQFHKCLTPLSCYPEEMVKSKMKRALTLVEGLPIPMSWEDLPVDVSTAVSYVTAMEVLERNLVWVQGASFGFVNSFEETERIQFRSLQRIYGATKFMPVATLLSFGVHKEVPRQVCTWQKWLDQCTTKSVLYIGVGSRVSNSIKSQLMNALEGLIQHFRKFKWSFIIVLPGLDAGNQKRLQAALTNGRGFLVCDWVDQRDVLSHTAIGAFLTHGGWNSIIDAVNCGIPMIVWPQRAEQYLNRKLLVDVWKIAVDIREGDLGLLVSQLLGARGKELQRRIELLRERIAAGTENSDTALDMFVAVIQQPGFRDTAVADFSLFLKEVRGEDEEADDARFFANDLFKDGAYQEALSYYEIALDHLNHSMELREAKRATVYNNMAACYLKLSKPDDALSCCKLCIENGGGNAKSYFRQSQAHMALQQWEDAVSSVTKALELEPQNVEVAKLLARAKSHLTSS